MLILAATDYKTNWLVNYWECKYGLGFWLFVLDSITDDTYTATLGSILSLVFCLFVFWMIRYILLKSQSVAVLLTSALENNHLTHKRPMKENFSERW